MKEGRTIIELARVLERQADAKQDFLVHDKAMTLAESRILITNLALSILRFD